MNLGICFPFISFINNKEINTLTIRVLYFLLYTIFAGTAPIGNYAEYNKLKLFNSSKYSTLFLLYLLSKVS